MFHIDELFCFTTEGNVISIKVAKCPNKQLIPLADFTDVTGMRGDGSFTFSGWQAIREIYRRKRESARRLYCGLLGAVLAIAIALVLYVLWCEVNGAQPTANGSALAFVTDICAWVCVPVGAYLFLKPPTKLSDGAGNVVDMTTGVITSATGEQFRIGV